MKHKLWIIPMLLCLLTVLVLPICGASAYLADEAQLLTAEEAAQVESQLSQISARHGVAVVVVTVSSTDGKTAEDFADDYFDKGGYGTDGVLLLVSTQDNVWWISTAGFGITAITDRGREYIAERFVPYLSDGEYALAFGEFAALCDEFINQAKTGEPYDGSHMPQEPFAFGFSLVIALVIGLVAALIVTGNMKGKLKSVRRQVRADDYVEPGSLKLTYTRDLFLYSQLDKREKPKSSEESGSTTHTSASGTTHGGGGGTF